MAFRKKHNLKRASRTRGTNLADNHPRPAKIAVAVLRNSHSAKAADHRLKPPVIEEKRVPALASEAPPARERGSYDADTAIKLYLREIGQVKLLTPEQEVELAAKIKKGDKKAREQMIKANLRLVVKIAHD